MRSIALSAFISIPLLTSCYYRTHVRMVREMHSDPPVLNMKVGERRKIASKTILTEISMGFMMGPAHSMRSSQNSVAKIDSTWDDWTAWVKAVAPGQADVYYRDSYVRVVVRPKENGHP